MRRLLLAIVVCFTAAKARPAPLDGAWAGGISLGGWYPIRLEIHGGDGRVFAGRATEGQPLSHIKNATQASFDWNEEDGLVHFEGTVDGENLRGTATQGSQSGAFVLAKVVSVDTRFFDPLAGVYELAPRDYVWIGRASELRRQPSFIHLSTGRFGTLYARTPTDFFSGRGAYAPAPRDVSIRFENESLIFRVGNTRPRRARRVRRYREEAVEFNNGNVKLAGTVITPLNAGRHPAVVFLHGSGAQNRTYFSALPYLLAMNGVASLVYDKRGVGGSTGNRFESTFDDLADDAIAGLHMLQQRADIDPDRIGVFGHSQGGWTGPLAAVRSKDVKFVVMAAGAAVSVDQQIKDQTRRTMQHADFTRAEIEEAGRYLDLFFAVREGRATFAELQAAYESASRSRWSRFAWKPSTEAKIKSNRAEVYDPEATLRALRVPVLALFGSADDNVHPDDNRARLEMLLAQNHNVSVKVFEGANHDFQLATADPLDVKSYAPGYFSTIANWIAATTAPALRQPSRDTTSGN